MNGPHLILENINMEFSTPYGFVDALKGINLEVKMGTFVSIVGHSGSGKSTLLSVMGGLLTPTSGTLSVNGQHVYGASEQHLCRYRAEKVGFVFQAASLLPSLTVTENLVFPGLFLKGKRNIQAAEEEAAGYLGLIGLGGKADVYPYQLSGGEARRVSLIRALMNKPEILLADEPTGDLDENTEIQVMDLLERVHKETGATLILVTHDAELAKRATRQFRMAGGDLRELSH